MIQRLDIQTVTENSLTAAFTLDRSCPVTALLRDARNETALSSGPERTGRFHFRDLASDTDYTLRLVARENVLRVMHMRTLSTPEGALSAKFAVIADPHVSTRVGLYKGRLFAESVAVLREIVREINRERVDFTLVPGDVTDQGLPEEFALASAALAELTCPCLVVPGDHDVLLDATLFEKTFGVAQWAKRLHGLDIIGCNTAQYSLGPDGFRHIHESLNAATGRVIMISHTQLLPDEYIVDEDRVIRDWRLFEERALPTIPRGTIAYVGHKNVPSQLRRGNFFQLNAPQPVQYPCGYLMVRCYENGIYHNFRPIFSEALNDVSREMSNARSIPKWEESYRRGSSHELWNFVFPSH